MKHRNGWSKRTEHDHGYYGHNLEFGYFLDPGSREPERTLDIAQRVDALGYDLIGIQDHPYQPAHFDAVALSVFILGQTERVRLFQDVANLPMRHPVVLAKTAATLDRLSGGRVELGLGAGAFWDAIRGLGGPVRKPKAALDALEEAVIVIRGMWSGERGMRFGGEYYPLPALTPDQPRPTRSASGSASWARRRSPWRAGLVMAGFLRCRTCPRSRRSRAMRSSTAARRRE